MSARELPNSPFSEWLSGRSSSRVLNVSRLVEVAQSLAVAGLSLQEAAINLFCTPMAGEPPATGVQSTMNGSLVVATAPARLPSARSQQGKTFRGTRMDALKAACPPLGA